MPKTIAIDTNVVVRYLTGDHATQSPVAAELFRAAQTGKVTLVIPASTIQETVYALERLYHLDGALIATKLLSLLAIPNVSVPEARWLMDGLQMYRSKNSDFGDALLCAAAHHHGWHVATFDQGLIRKFPEVTAYTPTDWLAEKEPNPPTNGH
jgi:predicted nucleic-acid-binding protein